MIHKRKNHRKGRITALIAGLWLACLLGGNVYADPACELEATDVQPAGIAWTLESLAGSVSDSLTAAQRLQAIQLAAELDNVVLVDLRKADQFNRYHIPGSLNLPGYVIKTKTYLREKRVVLIDEGAHPLALQALVKELNEADYANVWVLDGGLTAWIRQGGKVDGDPFAAHQVNQLEPEALLQQISWPGWRFIVMRKSAFGEQIKMPLPAHEIALGQKTEATLIKEISAAITSLKSDGDENINIVLLGDPQIENWQLEMWAERISYPYLFVLHGGIGTLLEAARRQEQIQTAQGVRGGKKRCGSL